jgi:hypothetical protein
MKALIGLALASAFTVPAMAAPVRAPGHDLSGSIVLAEGGCGPYAHRDYYGYCRPNQGYYPPPARYVCPPGWHFGGGRCWPN